MNKNTENNTDKKIRAILSSTEIEASDNLKFRIMHRIQTEYSIASKETNKREKLSTSFPNIFRVLGVMYLILGILVGATYLYAGKEALLSPTLWGTGILVIIITSVFIIISYLDSQLNTKRKHRRY